MAQLDNLPPIIIKKKKKGHGHGGHHGGAWKVAYADFVTAMMAFFLMLWLLNATSEEQRTGLADYFSPNTVSTSTNSGAGGMLGGLTVTAEGAAVSNRAPMGVTVGLPEDAEGTSPNDLAEDSPDADGRSDDTGQQSTADQLGEDRIDEALRAREEARFAETAETLRQAIQSVPELMQFTNNLLIDQTQEGLRIQIVDQQGTSMFPLGSAQPYEHTREIIDLVTNAIGQLPNRIAVKGHTDARPFRGKGDYSNWELSSDRALATRRALVDAGLDDERVAYVEGKADRDPLNAFDPSAPENRRISIILLRGDASKDAPATEFKAGESRVDDSRPSIMSLGTSPSAAN
jgi:chemotaxis protein MotB